MKPIVINKEYSPTRCEICHKDDMFEAISNQCQRCVGLESLLVLDKAEIEESFEPEATAATTSFWASVLRVMLYCTLSGLAFYLLWTNPKFNVVNNPLWDKMYRATFMVAIPFFAFQCFSQDREANKRGWMSLVVALLILISNRFLLTYLKTLVAQ